MIVFVVISTTVWWLIIMDNYKTYWWLVEDITGMISARWESGNKLVDWSTCGWDEFMLDRMCRVVRQTREDPSVASMEQQIKGLSLEERTQLSYKWLKCYKYKQLREGKVQQRFGMQQSEVTCWILEWPLLMAAHWGTWGWQSWGFYLVLCMDYLLGASLAHSVFTWLMQAELMAWRSPGSEMLHIPAIIVEGNSVSAVHWASKCCQALW